MRAIVGRMPRSRKLPLAGVRRPALAASEPVAPMQRLQAAPSSGLALLLALTAATLLPGQTLAATSLQSGSVSPRSGTTSALFAFRVSASGKSPTAVTARLMRAGGGTLQIALTPSNGGKL